MMGVFSCVCSGVLWGRGGLQCRILGGVIVSFLGRWYRGWEEKAPRPMKFELCSLHDAPSNRPKFVYLLCIICYILYKQSTTVVVVSLYATAGMYWFSVCWGHVTNVTQEG